MKRNKNRYDPRAAINEEKRRKEEEWKIWVDTQIDSLLSNSFENQMSSPNKTINESNKSGVRVDVKQNFKDVSHFK